MSRPMYCESSLNGDEASRTGYLNGHQAGQNAEGCTKLLSTEASRERGPGTAMVCCLLMGMVVIPLSSNNDKTSSSQLPLLAQVAQECISFVSYSLLSLTYTHHSFAAP